MRLQSFVGGFEVIEVTSNYIDVLQSLVSTENILEDSFPFSQAEQQSMSADDGKDAKDAKDGSDYPGDKAPRFLLASWMDTPIGFAPHAVYVALSEHLASQGVWGYGVYAARDLNPPPEPLLPQERPLVLTYYGGVSYPDGLAPSHVHFDNPYNVHVTCRRKGECSQSDHPNPRSGRSTHMITVMGDPMITANATFASLVNAPPRSCM